MTQKAPGRRGGRRQRSGVGEKRDPTLPRSGYGPKRLLDASSVGQKASPDDPDPSGSSAGLSRFGKGQIRVRSLHHPLTTRYLLRGTWFSVMNVSDSPGIVTKTTAGSQPDPPGCPHLGFPLPSPLWRIFFVVFVVQIIQEVIRLKNPLGKKRRGVTAEKTSSGIEGKEGKNWGARYVRVASGRRSAVESVPNL